MKTGYPCLIIKGEFENCS